MEWMQLTDSKQLEKLIDDSKEATAVIFKHSTRCAISRMALRQFESEFDAEGITPYFLDLLQHRDISNEIARRFEVIHQSPQLIVVKNGNAVYHASHENINAQKLKEFD